ncbi:MAG: hypothetical protein RLZZ182_2267 [Pseudomonadota bacterium]
MTPPRLMFRLLPGLPWLVSLVWPTTAQAHVKWFSKIVNCTSAPLDPWPVVTQPLFLALWLLATVVLGWVFFAERLLLPSYRRAHLAWHARKPAGQRALATVLRLGVALYFASLMAGMGPRHAMLTPELVLATPWIPACQSLIVVSVLWRRTAPLAALGLLALYAVGMTHAGWFHMLDYLYFVGVAIFLLIDAWLPGRHRHMAYTALRVAASFSLLWVSAEKWMYPAWTYDLLQGDLQALSFGLPPHLVVMAGGFVEFTLAFLLLFGRVSAQVSALVFLLLMAAAIPVAGPIDAIGHAPLLIVLLIFGFSQNRLGYRGHRARQGHDVRHVLTFVLGVPGVMGLYKLAHQLAYPHTPAVPEVSWLMACLGASLLLVHLLRTAPDWWPSRLRTVRLRTKAQADWATADKPALSA